MGNGKYMSSQFPQESITLLLVLTHLFFLCRLSILLEKRPSFSGHCLPLQMLQNKFHWDDLTTFKIEFTLARSTF